MTTTTLHSNESVSTTPVGAIRPDTGLEPRHVRAAMRFVASDARPAPAEDTEPKPAANVRSAVRLLIGCARRAGMGSVRAVAEATRGALRFVARRRGDLGRAARSTVRAAARAEECLELSADEAAAAAALAAIDSARESDPEAVHAVRRAAVDTAIKAGGLPTGPISGSAHAHTHDEGTPNMNTDTTPVLHAALFDSPQDAEAAITRLLTAGVSRDDISVVCPADLQERFASLTPKAPAGEGAAPAATGGALAGATLGGLATLAGALTGGLAALAAGPLLLAAGGVSGGLVGAMVSRGVESRLARYYDHAVRAGRILVAVSADHPAARQLDRGAADATDGARIVDVPA